MKSKDHKKEREKKMKQEAGSTKDHPPQTKNCVLGKKKTDQHSENCILHGTLTVFDLLRAPPFPPFCKNLAPL
jgi:uncharacterized Fe-S cluster protein YjdI